MKLPVRIKVLGLITMVWAVIAGFVIYLVRTDNGLYAQIAVPIFFGIIYLVLGLIFLYEIFITYRTKLNKKHKLLSLGLVIVPILLAFLFVEVYKSAIGL